MIPYRRPASTYALYFNSPQARAGRATRAVVRWTLRMLPRAASACVSGLALAWRRRGDLAVVGMFALMAWMPVRDADREMELQTAHSRAAAAEIQLTALADWHRDNTARVTIEGKPSTVANLALQVAATVR